MAHSLHTASFLLALRRFIARRGQVKEMCSDNGGPTLQVESMSYASQLTLGTKARFPKKCYRETSNGVSMLFMVCTMEAYGNDVFVQFEEFFTLFSRNKQQTMKVLLLLCARWRAF